MLGGALEFGKYCQFVTGIFGLRVIGFKQHRAVRLHN
jgi:hypothetical protein